MSVKIKYFSSLVLFSTLVVFIGLMLFGTVLKELFLPVFYILILYFPILTIAGRLFLVKSDPGNPGQFNARYFMIRWIKVLLHLIFIVVYLLTDRENIPAFIFTFLACYVLFSVFDTYTLSNYLKKNNQF